jgi:integrase
MSTLYMTEADIKTLMTLAKQHPRDYALLRIMASTGLRIGDICRLRRDQMIDSDRQIVRTLRIRIEKTDRWIVQTLRQDAREAIKAYLDTREDSYPWLFISQSSRSQYFVDGPLTRGAAHLIMKRYLTMIYPASLIRGAATHVLRRSIAKLISRKTGRIETVQEWLGHSSLAHTRVYIDADDYREKATEVVEKLDI